MSPFRHATCLAILLALCPIHASGQDVPPLTRVAFDSLFGEVDNAGRWGADDERGTLNLITPDVRRAASDEVRTGITVSMATEMVHGVPEGGFGPIAVDLQVLSDSALGPSDGSVIWAAERTSLFYHGWAYTHIDALSHMPSYRGRGYNGAPLAHRPPAGQQRNSVAAMSDGLVTRGVLVDLPALLGVDFVAPGGAITPDHLEAWERRSGVRVREGDVVLIRSGRWSRQAMESNVDGSAGIHPTLAPWLNARGVAALGDEGGTDTSPTSVDGINSPMHVLSLVAMGMPLIENLDLEALAAEAAAQQRWTFMFVLAPLHVRGATGSPANPIAVF
jgi:kynurenine formamidase